MINNDKNGNIVIHSNRILFSMKITLMVGSIIKIHPYSLYITNKDRNIKTIDSITTIICNTPITINICDCIIL